MDAARLIELVVVLSAVPIAVWIIKTLLDVKEAVGELRVFLIGIDGQNGIRSTVNKLDERLKLLEQVP